MVQKFPLKVTHFKSKSEYWIDNIIDQYWTSLHCRDKYILTEEEENPWLEHPPVLSSVSWKIRSLGQECLSGDKRPGAQLAQHNCSQGGGTQRNIPGLFFGVFKIIFFMLFQ